MTLKQKKQKLESLIRDMGSVLVAFSGGVDSTLVLAMSHMVLGKKSLAVTAHSESLPERELREAKRLAREIGVEHLIIETNEMASPQYTNNPINRCYYCKSELYSQLTAIAGQRNLAFILNGINLDDMGDHRPGILAAKESGVQSPLSEAGFTKQDVRDLSRELNLPNWKKPAMACLSSRIPYGDTISTQKLSMIEQAEDVLDSLGFTQFRVRHHGEIARIELPKENLADFLAGSFSETVREQFIKIGFKYVTLDLEGYRSGRMNEGIPLINRDQTTICGKSN